MLPLLLSLSMFSTIDESEIHLPDMFPFSIETNKIEYIV